MGLTSAWLSFFVLYYLLMIVLYRYLCILNGFYNFYSLQQNSYAGGSWKTHSVWFRSRGWPSRVGRLSSGNRSERLPTKVLKPWDGSLNWRLAGNQPCIRVSKAWLTCWVWCLIEHYVRTGSQDKRLGRYGIPNYILINNTQYHRYFLYIHADLKQFKIHMFWSEPSKKEM